MILLNLFQHFRENNNNIYTKSNLKIFSMKLLINYKMIIKINKAIL